ASRSIFAKHLSRSTGGHTFRPARISPFNLSPSRKANGRGAAPTLQGTVTMGGPPPQQKTNLALVAPKVARPHLDLRERRFERWLGRVFVVQMPRPRN